MNNSQKSGDEISIKTLSELLQLDVDAVEAYEQALKNIKTAAIYEKLESFKGDHVSHVKTLSQLITKLGGTVPSQEKDFKGFLIKGMTAIRSLGGETSALKAMKTNEELTTKTYEKALKLVTNEEAKKLIEKNYQDEKRHLNYIISTLEKKG